VTAVMDGTGPQRDSVAAIGGPPISRRRALAVIGGSVVTAGAAPLLFAACTPPVPVDVTVGLDPATLAVDEPSVIEFDFIRPDGSTGAGSAWLVRGSDGSLVAYDPRCPHQGCLYDWEDGDDRFVCVCHEAAFDLDGGVLFGPPRRPLDRFPVVVYGAEIVLTVPSDLRAPRTEA
jgi:Rieske Fe-S protein